MKIKLLPRSTELRRIEMDRLRKPQLQFIRTAGDTLRNVAGQGSNRTGSSSGIYQPLDADLTAIAALTSAADKVPYSTGAQAWSLAAFTSFARTLVDDANAAAARSTLSAAVLGANGDITSMTGLTGGVAAATYYQMATGLSPSTPGAGLIDLYASSGNKHPYAINENGSSWDLTDLKPYACMKPFATLHSSTSGTSTATSDLGIVVYYGRAYKNVASGATITITSVVTTAWVTAGTTPWAEVAILRGSRPALGGNPSLTVIGTLAISSSAGTGLKTYVITLTSAIEAGDELWIGSGSKATTNRMAWRSQGVAEEFATGLVASKASQGAFSALGGSPVSFTMDSSSQSPVFFLYLE